MDTLRWVIGFLSCVLIGAAIMMFSERHLGVDATTGWKLMWSTSILLSIWVLK